MAQEGSSSSRFKAKKIDGEVSASTSFVAPPPIPEPAHVHTSMHDQEAVPYNPQPSSSEPNAPPSEGGSSDGSTKGANLMFIALIAFVLYALAGGVDICPRRQDSPQRNYRPLGEQTGDKDSDEGDEEDTDPSARRRMMQELSSFGSGQRKEATGVASDSAIAANSANSNTSSFPMTNFSSIPSAGVSHNQPDHGARAPPDEDAADQLQRELELFAQDDDEEEGALMTTSYADRQPQNAHAQPQARDDEDDSNELQEYETFFDGGH